MMRPLFTANAVKPNARLPLIIITLYPSVLIYYLLQSISYFSKLSKSRR